MLPDPHRCHEQHRHQHARCLPQPRRKKRKLCEGLCGFGEGTSQITLWLKALSITGLGRRTISNGALSSNKAFSKNHPGTLKVDPFTFRVGDTGYQMSALLQLGKRSWVPTRGFQLLWKGLELKHSSCWHTGCPCWPGWSKGTSPLCIKHPW